MNDRNVSLSGRFYEVDPLLVGQTVTLRYDPSVAPSRPLQVRHNGADEASPPFWMPTPTPTPTPPSSARPSWPLLALLADRIRHRLQGAGADQHRGVGGDGAGHPRSPLGRESPPRPLPSGRSLLRLLAEVSCPGCNLLPRPVVYLFAYDWGGIADAGQPRLRRPHPRCIDFHPLGPLGFYLLYSGAPFLSSSVASRVCPVWLPVLAGRRCLLYSPAMATPRQQRQCSALPASITCR